MPAVAKKNIKNIYPLTPLQEGMLFHTLYDPDSLNYFELTRFHLAGSVNPTVFEATWNELLRRHDILRTVFIHKHVPEPLQVVLKERRIDFRFQDCQSLSGEEQASILADCLNKERTTRFSLDNDCLMRIRLFQWSSDSYEVIWTYHHIVLDGWSLAILRDEFQKIYCALLEKREPVLPPPVPFNLYVQWLKHQETQKNRAFWKQYLKGFARPTLITCESTGPTVEYQAAAHELRLSEAETSRLRDLALNGQVTLNVLVQGLWGLILAGWRHVEDVVFATTVSGRPPELPGIERMVGLCINAVPVRIHFNRAASFSEVLKSIQQTAAESKAYHYGSLADIQSDSCLRHRLLDHLLVFENYPDSAQSLESIEAGGPPFVMDHYEHTDHTNYPLTIQVAPSSQLGFRFIFNELGIGRDQVELLSNTLKKVVCRISEKPDASIRNLLETVVGETSLSPIGSTVVSTPQVCPQVSPVIHMIIAATFTADPLVSHIQEYGRQFGLEVEVSLAPYNQVFQQLLDPASVMNQQPGIHLFFIRFEDWLRDANTSRSRSLRDWERQLEMLISATDRPDANTENWFVVCPLSTHLDFSPKLTAGLHRLQERWIDYLPKQTTCRWIDCRNTGAHYQVNHLFDLKADQVGHLPFTEEYYACLAASIARQIVCRNRTPFKVIVTDCDHTLWRGLCGEDGVHEVIIDGGYQALQEFLARAVGAGFLLALCSKNEESDVWAVFDRHQDMPLKRRQVAAYRINWRPKSENIREIAHELGLGLDSVIFIDDSAMECAEVMSRCPEVFTLKLPNQDAVFGHFLSHVWAFDRFRITVEDRKRTEFYQAERSRDHIRHSGLSLDAFLRRLRIKVVLSPVSEIQASRVAQLTQRTNQFNNRAIRRTERDIRSLRILPDSHCWAVHVSDNFGDYGLAGAIIARLSGEELHIDTLALSCRILGRRVEDAVLCALRWHCERHHIKSLRISFKPAERNQVLLDFLRRTLWQAKSETQASMDFRIDTDSLPNSIADIEVQLMTKPWSLDETRASVPRGSLAHPPPLAPSHSCNPVLQWEVMTPDPCPVSHRGYYRMLEGFTGARLLQIPVEPSAEKPPSHRRPLRLPENESQRKMLPIWQTLLGRSEIGIDEDFFALGGHSLKATRLLSRVSQQFERDLSLKDIFDAPTIEQLCRRIEDGHLSAMAPIPAIARQPSHDLSHAQRRLWILQRMETNSIAYNNSGFYLIEGPLDVECLTRAFSALVNRHESLRTTFEEVNHSPVQKIHEPIDWRVRHLDWRNEDHSHERICQFARELSRQPFDLSTLPLFTVCLISVRDHEHVLMLHMHHIISDGWSLGVMEREVMSVYRAFTKQEPVSLPPLRIQYKDYAAWHNSLLTQPAAASARRYWREQFQGEIGQLDLPADAARPPVQSFNGRLQEFSVDPGLWKRFRQIGTDLGATPFALLVALVKVLLFRYTRQEDIIVGTPVNGRSHPDLENLCGFFVNTLPLRDRVNARQSFSELVRRVRRTMVDAFEHQMYPFDLIVQDLKLARDVSRPPLFDVMVVFEKVENDNSPASSLRFRPLTIDACISRFDLTFQFAEIQTDLAVTVTYDSDRFSQNRIARLAGHFVQLLSSVAGNAAAPIGSLEMLAPAENRQLLCEFNQQPISPPCTRTITDLFEEQAKRTPQNLALIAGQENWTYQDLDAAANRLAALLNQETQIQPDELIAVMVEDRKWAIIAALGIMKAGAAYLPIDLHYPARRIEYILRDSNCARILTDRPGLPGMDGGQTRPMRLDQLDVAGIPAVPPPASDRSCRHLAYAIYTSGSTGQPKGVLIEHQGFVNMILQQIAAFEVTDASRIAQFASPSFDASLSEIFMALLSGATLCLPSQEQRKDAEAFGDFLERMGITVVTLPPGFLNALDKKPLTFLKTLITAGEPANAGDASHYAQQLRYFNAYGPTETSVCATFYRVPPGSTRSPVPIGKGLCHLGIYLLDEDLHLVPLGVPGEICVSGVGLARGYLNQPQLTAEKFVPHPYLPGARLYKTGDWGRWAEDGNLEFIGRVDNQVKIRGHRVEIDEVRHHLCSHRKVREAVVVPVSRPGMGTLLAAYIVSTAPLERQELMAFLAERLPEYAIPSAIRCVERLPLNAHGKVDRQLLLLPQDGTGDGPHPKLLPRTAPEKEMAEIWSVVLGRSDIGLQERFFDLGGDSIAAIQTISRLRRAGWRLEVKDLYLRPTIEQLVAQTHRESVTTRAAITELITGEVKLTAIQRWFFGEFPGERHHFNHWEMLLASGGFDAEAVSKAFTAIQLHHDALRLTYRLNLTAYDDIVQWNAGVEHPFYFEMVDLRAQSDPRNRLERHAAEVQASLNLEAGPLMKIVLYRAQDGDRLLVVIHHLVVDAISWRIILEDFIQSYHQLRRNEPVSLPVKTDSFQTWAAAVDAYSTSPELLQEMSYWQQIESMVLSPLQWDRTLDEPQEDAGDCAETGLSADDTTTLINGVCPYHHASVQDVLLSVLARCIGKWSQTHPIRILLEGHGREPMQPNLDVSRTVGWFTTAFPVLLDCPVDISVSELIPRTREILRAIPNHGLGYGILKYLTPTTLTKDITFQAKPQISFNYLGHYGREIGPSDIQFAQEKGGDSVSIQGRYLSDLSFNAMVANKALRITMVYDMKVISSTMAARIMNTFQQELLLLIQSQREAPPTPRTSMDLTRTWNIYRT